MYAPTVSLTLRLDCGNLARNGAFFDQACCISMPVLGLHRLGVNHRGAAKLLWTITTNLNTTIQIRFADTFSVFIRDFDTRG
jgi:hypothetical protein